VVNREELNWLLQTIKDPETAERFVLAQYDRGRIPSHVMADVARERGWINRTANQLLTTGTRHSRNRTVPTKLIHNIDKEEAANASIDGILGKGDMPLVAAAKNGNRKAFEILVERHEQRIFFVARRITRTREDAEDVVQQSFQKAFTHLRKFEERSSFSTWLTRITITEALMFLRRSRGLREVFIDDLNGSEETTTALEVPDSSPDPEAIYSQQEQVEVLSLAMNELPYGTRRAIQLRELEERSSEETALVMGISVSALKGRMFHGRKKLRERLKHIVEPAWRSARKTSRTIGNTTHIAPDQLACNASG
jgi:RNA polymerase sigma-70 factor (ECF subfamily)